MRNDQTEMLSEAELADRMRTECMGRTLYYYDETTSTNEDAKRLALEKAPNGTLVVADSQTRGRGRRGRDWESPAGRSIYFSLLVYPDFDRCRTSMLTLVMALSVAYAVEKACDCRMEQGCPSDVAANQKGAVLIKWPNDLVMESKKICGILTELLTEEDANSLIIGVGINVNQQDSMDFPEQIREYAGSVRMAMGWELNRADLIADVMWFFEINYKIFRQTCDMTGLKDFYECRLANIGRQVKILDPKGEYIGIARGINSHGELQVEKEDGTVVSVYAGEVSVRGLYGYI